MRKSTIKHEYLRRVIEEVESQGDDPSVESLENMVNEIKHSCLIMAADIMADGINFPSVNINDEDFALLFTDLDEFHKVFPNNEYGAHENVFGFFREVLNHTNIKGFIINIESECFIIWDELVEMFGDMPVCNFNSEDSYTTEELKQLKDSINNDDLEKFIEDPQNIGRYEELFDKISQSHLLILRLIQNDFGDELEDGVMNLKEIGPAGFLYKDDFYGNYAPVYTSESKMSNVHTHLNKFSQLVNFSQMANSVLAEDMDGIIINPSTDNLLITRDVLLEFSPVLEEICNDSKLNSGIYHIFSMEEI